MVQFIKIAIWKLSHFIGTAFIRKACIVMVFVSKLQSINGRLKYENGAAVQ